jgi:uncharacterized repeat protein (TIGR01451 family)
MSLISVGRSLAGSLVLFSTLLGSPSLAAAQAQPVSTPDLTISETVTPAQVAAGDQVSFTATVRNVGASAASTTVWLSIPEGVSLLSEQPSIAGDLTCTIDPAWVRCTGTVAPDRAALITLRGTVESAPADHFFWLAAVDPEDLVEERDDLNNSTIVSARVLTDVARSEP